MREVSKLCSILDDAAATGSAEKLWRLSGHWRGKLNTRRSGTDAVPVVWAHASDAAYFRAKAIEHRLAGRIQNALKSEEASERALRAAAEHGTRFTRRYT